MNSYGQRAMNHWRQWFPGQIEQMSDPQEHFTQLGQEMEARVQELGDQLAGPDSPGETYLDKVGRLNAAKSQAKELVMSEYLPAPPEPQDEELEEDDPVGLVMEIQRLAQQAREELGPQL
jgi:hypothetical protein